MTEGEAFNNFSLPCTIRYHWDYGGYSMGNGVLARSGRIEYSAKIRDPVLHCYNKSSNIEHEIVGCIE